MRVFSLFRTPSCLLTIFLANICRFYVHFAQGLISPRQFLLKAGIYAYDVVRMHLCYCEADSLLILFKNSTLKCNLELKRTGTVENFSSFIQSSVVT